MEPLYLVAELNEAILLHFNPRGKEIFDYRDLVKFLISALESTVTKLQ